MKFMVGRERLTPNPVSMYLVEGDQAFDLNRCDDSIRTVGSRRGFLLASGLRYHVEQGKLNGQRLRSGS